jgi:hypothetical protein
MNIFLRIIEALHRSREREAHRTIRRYAHLVEEAHEYDRRSAAAKDAADGRSLAAVELESELAA